MQRSYTVLLILLIALVSLNCRSADLEGRGNLETNVDPKNAALDQNDKANHQAGSGLVEQNNNSTDSQNKDSIKTLGSNEAGSEQKKKTTDLVADKASDSTEKEKESTNGKPKQGTMEEDRNSGLRGDECDSSSNSCKIEDKALVACLRVPGNESPDLSLLIQNKGKGTASVIISTPAFVQLEANLIEVPENENKRVKVSIGHKGTGSVMVLKVGNGNCSLDFKDLITQGTLKYHVSTSQFAVINFFKNTSVIWFLFLAAFLVIALLGTFFSLWRKHSADNKPKYEKLDMELPVSSGSKRMSESNDGWDDGWGDSWDDEEAPKPPSAPVTPSRSQGIIASRRINKEGWKD